MAINRCLHQDKFYCTTVTVENGTTYAYACTQRCGFWINFNPIHAGTVRDKPAKDDPYYDSWSLLIMAFHPVANPNAVWKDPQPLAVEGRKMGKEEFK